MGSYLPIHPLRTVVVVEISVVACNISVFFFEASVFIIVVTIYVVLLEASRHLCKSAKTEVGGAYDDKQTYFTPYHHLHDAYSLVIDLGCTVCR